MDKFLRRGFVSKKFIRSFWDSGINIALYAMFILYEIITKKDLEESKEEDED